MANTIQILGRTYLPGGGFNTSGTPKQGKTMTWGYVNVSSYDATNGESVNPNSLGLTAIDYVSFTPSVINNAAIADNLDPSVVWRPTGGTGSAGSINIFSTATTEATTATVQVVRFFAVGDSARDVESLA